MGLQATLALRNQKTTIVISEDIHDAVARRQRELQAKFQAQGYQTSEFTSTDDSRNFQAECEALITDKSFSGLIGILVNSIANNELTIDQARRNFQTAISA